MNAKTFLFLGYRDLKDMELSVMFRTGGSKGQNVVVQGGSGQGAETGLQVVVAVEVLASGALRNVRQYTSYDEFPLRSMWCAAASARGFVPGM